MYIFPQKNPTISTSHGQRIYIPEEKITIERPIPPKTMPSSYRQWLIYGDNQSRT
jgi:hypothetical protein